jgi:hypothetical protein
MAMKRIRVKIADSLLAHLDAIVAAEKTSRDEIIARAVAAYVALRIAEEPRFWSLVGAMSRNRKRISAKNEGGVAGQADDNGRQMNRFIETLENKKMQRVGSRPLPRPTMDST